MRFNSAAPIFHRRSLNIINQNHRMRITHIHTAYRYRLQTDQDNMCQRIFRFTMRRHKRNFRRHETRFTHIDGNQTVIQQLRYNNPFGRFDQNFRFIRQTLIRDKTRKTTRSIAALLYFPTIGIENAVPKIDRIRRRLLHYQKLIKTHAAIAVCPLGKRRSQRIKVLIDGINHHKIIAQAVHLRKFQSFHYLFTFLLNHYFGTFYTRMIYSFLSCFSDGLAPFYQY